MKKKEAVIVIFSLATRFLGDSPSLNELKQLAYNSIYYNPKFGALDEASAQDMWQHIQTIFSPEPASAQVAQEEQPTPYAAYVAAMEAAVPEGKLPRSGKTPSDKSLEERRAARRFMPY